MAKMTKPKWDEKCPWCDYDISDSLRDWSQGAGDNGQFTFYCFGCSKPIRGHKRTEYVLERDKVKA